MDDDWIEEERQRALKWTKWACLLLAAGWASTFIPTVVRLCQATSPVMVVLHALSCGLYSVVYPYFIRSTMAHIRALKEARKPPKKT